VREIVGMVVSSGIVSAIVSLLSVVFTTGKYKQKVETNEKELDKHDIKISEISDRISRLEGGIDRDRIYQNSYIQRKSPLSLTEKGKAVLLDSKGKDFIDKNKDNLLENLKNLNPKTSYDVQELSRKILDEETKKEDFNKIKEYAFKNGLQLDLIMDIMGIYLRDEVLSDFNFNVNDL
jgi:hypothetical protein